MHRAFNLITKNGSVLTKVNKDIVMVIQVGSDLSIRFLDGSTNIFTNSLDEVVHGLDIFPIITKNYLGAVNAQHVRVCQRTPENYTEIFFHSYTGLKSIVSQQTQEETLTSINGDSEHLGSVLFEDTQYVGATTFEIPKDTEVSIPNNVGNITNYDAPAYAENWVNNLGVVITDRSNVDFYLLTLSFVANPSRKDEVLDIRFTNGVTNLWSKTVILNKDEDIDTNVSENVFFFSSSLLSTTGASFKIRSVKNDVELTDIKFLVSPISRVDVD